MKRIALALLAAALTAAALAPERAVAQNLTVTVPAVPPGGAAPFENAVVMGVSSPIYLTVTNGRPATIVTEITFEGNQFETIIGGAAPPGWSITDVTATGKRTYITFRVSSCGTGGLANGQSGTFRIDYRPPAGPADTTMTFRSITPSDPCGGTSGWPVVPSPAFPARSLSIAAAVAPPGGPSSLSTTVTYVVTNQSTTARTVSMALPTITPAGGTPSACTPASLALPPNGGSGSFTCPVTLTAGTPTVFTIASNASAPGASGVGAAATATVSPVRAAFAFDSLGASSGDVVRATLTVTNDTAAGIAVTPPTYAGLTLASLAPATGVVDPVPVASLASGATATFSYALSVSGPPGAAYTASASTATSAGPTNVATTPPGTIGAWSATWTPPVIVTSRTPAPFPFVVTVTNRAAVALTRVDLVNPQNDVWTGMANVSATGLTCGAPAISLLASGTTTRIRCTGSLAQGSTATMSISFSGIGAAGTYPFNVVIYSPDNVPMQTITQTVTVRTIVDFDVASLTIGSTAVGQTLQWVNTSTSTGTHDGVVIFRTAAPAVPPLPADGVRYTPGSGQVVYADEYASPVTSFVDPSPGAWNYRVCNHDSAFIYSNCNSGFWNGAGWLDSVTPPAGGWAHQTGTAVFLAPGVIPAAGLIGVATNTPSAVVLAAAAGDRRGDPVALGGPPSNGVPAAQLGSGLRALFAADSGGRVTAVNLSTGAVAWSSTQAGQSFVGGVAGALASMLPAAYGTDVLFLGSTSGALLAVDARTGAVLWTVAVGSPVRALATHDTTGGGWRLYVPTDAGISAYDLSASQAGVAPVVLAGWTNPGGQYTLGCTLLPYAGITFLACADDTGIVRLLDRATGAVAASFATGLSSPSPWTIWRASSALVVGSSAKVVRLDVSGTAAAPSLAQAASWAPGLTLSRLQVFGSEGFVYVGGSDLRIHKLALSDLTELATSPVLQTQAPAIVLGQPAYDVGTDRLLVGASDGRLWAIPKF